MTVSFFPQQQPAPDFSLTAVGSKRPFRLSNQQPTPVLLTFVSYKQQDTVRDLNRAVRTQYADHTEVKIASILDTRVIPRLMRGVASSIMEGAYHQASQEIPADRDPADYLILLPDWNGKVFRAYQVPTEMAFMAVVAVAGNGRVAASYHGPDPVNFTLTTLPTLL